MIRQTASEHIKHRLDALHQLSRINAGSLIISCFGDAVLPRGGRIWLGSLIRLLEPLGVSDRLVRTTIFRLVKDEWLSAETVGRKADYSLTLAGQKRVEETSRHIYSSNTPVWDRRWRLILVVNDLGSKPRDQLRRALFWQGFGMTGPDCFIHPSADLTSAFDAIRTDGMGDLLKHLMPMIAADAGSEDSASDEDLIKSAWNLDQLSDAYRAFCEQYRPMLDALRHPNNNDMSDEHAFLARLLLIHDYRRLLLRDPELPDVLLPQQWSGQQARHICREIYLRLLTASERHLEQHLKLANRTTPKPQPMLARRFQNDDPLTGN